MWNCRVRSGSQWRAAYGATWRLLRSCGSVVDQELAVCVACHRGSVYRNKLRTVRGVERLEISDNGDVAATSAANRGQYVRRGQRLEYFTIAYNSVEGAASIVAGLLAGSVSLVGFGLDSMIEVASGAALLWRLHHDMDTSRREQVERTALRTVGACFVALALYIVYESSSTLDTARSTGAKHRWHRDRERFCDCHAAAGASETASCSSDWQRSYARGFETGGFLCVPLRDSLGWPAVECIPRLVVDGSRCRTGHGSNHRQGRRCRAPS